jgi:hypothetical protein
LKIKTFYIASEEEVLLTILTACSVAISKSGL